jgi:putative ABC transport system permease protein
MLVLPIKGSNSIGDRYESVKQEFLRESSVKAATVSDETPGKETESFAAWLPGQDDDKGQSMNYLFVDSDFIRVYGINLKAGRAFRKELRSDDTAAFVINEAATRAFGFASPEAAIGKQIQTGFSGRKGSVIGVCHDFHYRSLQTKVEPLIMAIKPDRFSNISLKISTQDVSRTLAIVEQKWKELFPQHPFEYFFLDESFDNQYRSDEKLSRIFFTFTLLTILIACLGLFGLATFTAERRTKEIGIRKVLGASVNDIVSLLSKDFLQLVLIANVIAWPLAYYAMYRWLQDFAYRISIDWWVFVLAGASALIIALFTVSFQAIRAATANPVKSLRTE